MGLMLPTWLLVCLYDLILCHTAGSCRVTAHWWCSGWTSTSWAKRKTFTPNVCVWTDCLWTSATLKSWPSSFLKRINPSFARWDPYCTLSNSFLLLQWKKCWLWKDSSGILTPQQKHAKAFCFTPYPGILFVFQCLVMCRSCKENIIHWWRLYRRACASLWHVRHSVLLHTHFYHKGADINLSGQHPYWPASQYH